MAKGYPGRRFRDTSGKYGEARHSSPSPGRGGFRPDHRYYRGPEPAQFPADDSMAGKPIGTPHWAKGPWARAARRGVPIARAIGRLSPFGRYGDALKFALDYYNAPRHEFEGYNFPYSIHCVFEGCQNGREKTRTDSNGPYASCSDIPEVLICLGGQVFGGNYGEPMTINAADTAVWFGETTTFDLRMRLQEVYSFPQTGEDRTLPYVVRPYFWPKVPAADPDAYPEALPILQPAATPLQLPTPYRSPNRRRGTFSTAGYASPSPVVRPRTGFGSSAPGVSYEPPGRPPVAAGPGVGAPPPVRRPVLRRTPFKRGKELKIHLGGPALQAALKVAGGLTEAADFFEALYKALPANHRSRSDRTPQAKAKRLWKHFDDFRNPDVLARAGYNLAANELQDRAIGAIGRKMKSASQRARPHGGLPIGFQSGPLH